MQRCPNCGRENPPGSLFCQSCGTKLGAQQPDPQLVTMSDGSGLPGSVRCSRCGTDNPDGMNFCRNCGNTLGGSGRVPAMQSGMREPQGAPMPSPSDVVGGDAGGDAANAPRQTCPHCSAQTPVGFAFCQQCGRKITELRNISPGTARHPSVISGETSSSPIARVGNAGPPGNAGPLGGGSGAAPVDAVAATVAADQSEEVARLRNRPGVATPLGGAPMTAPPTGDAMGGIAPGVAASPGAAPSAAGQVGPAWGRLISVNKDGSDGTVHSLAGAWLGLGRGGVDISFPEDRFLAREHIRLQHTPQGCAVVPVDTLNGVYMRVIGDMWLDHGTTLLFGREVVRFELVDEDERQAPPLMRHGVSLFGSPPRQPWGRLVELLASGGALDIRHLWQDAVTIGREDGDIVFPDDAFLSRRHARLSRHDGRCKLEDLDSSNGTFVRLRGQTPLQPGDHLRVGDQLLRFELTR